MIKNKKGLTISIEEPNLQNEIELQLSQLKAALNLIKTDNSSTWIILNQEIYQEEKMKLSSLNNSYLNQLFNYMEGINQSSDLSYSWVENNADILNISKCIFLTQKIGELMPQKDFSNEFKILKIITDDATHRNQRIILSKSLRLNNRYADLLPYEYNIAPYAFLDKYDQFNQNDWYINASFIDGPLRKDQKYFIATQGPLLSTAAKFYQMCFTHDTKLVVMLSSFEEEGRKKCDKYLPNSIEEKSNFNLDDDTKVKVTIQNEEWLIINCLIKRELLIKIKEETKVITHIQMVNWPDHLVPDDQSGYETIECLIQLIVEYRDMNPEIPIVIHCSAGIGRTGTFISIFNLVKCLRFYKSINPIDIMSWPKPFISIFNMVRKLREQRSGMVTSVEQYSYIYQFIFKWCIGNMELTE